MLAPTLNSCSALFPRDRARSDDPEKDLDPDTARPPIHPFTGRFADSEHTIAYRSKVFRIMMPLHVVAMALVICASLFVIFSDVVSSGDASLWTLDFVISATLILGVGARVAVHRWEDRVKAQQLGAVAWMITTVTALTADVMAGTQGQAHACCQSSALPVLPLICALCALVNATHGMEFWHTNLPTGLMFCDLATWRMACGDLLAINLAFVLLVVVHAFCHFNTLLSRHAFLETDYLHTSRERLEYDFQRLECGLHRLEAKLPAVVAGGSAPTESSESTSTAPGRAPRSTQSAPAAMVGGGRPMS